MTEARISPWEVSLIRRLYGASEAGFKKRQAIEAEDSPPRRKRMRPK